MYFIRHIPLDPLGLHDMIFLLTHRDVTTRIYVYMEGSSFVEAWPNGEHSSPPVSQQKEHEQIETPFRPECLRHGRTNRSEIEQIETNRWSCSCRIRADTELKSCEEFDVKIST